MNGQRRVIRANGGAAENARRHAANRRRKAIDAPTARSVWQCAACPADYDGRKPPDRCGKCGGSAFEKVKLQLRDRPPATEENP